MVPLRDISSRRLYDFATGESLNPDSGHEDSDGAGAPSSDIWDRPLGRPRPVRRPVHRRRLAQLKAMSYAEYLQTAEWDATRRETLYLAHNRCARCFSRDLPLDAHHKTYERLGEEIPSDLEALCRPCHQFEHGIAS